MTRHPHILLSLLVLLTFTCVRPALALDTTDTSGDTSAITDYIDMEPAFITHVGQPGPRVTYLKAAVTLRASHKTTRAAVEAHMPRLRHELVMLFGEQTDVDRLTTVAGQEALREAARERINRVLEEQHTGETVTEVLFTEFVVQK